MEAIPSSIKIARAACRIATQNVVFALVIKALFMVLGLAGIASMWFAVFSICMGKFCCVKGMGTGNGEGGRKCDCVFRVAHGFPIPPPKYGR